MSSSFIKLDRKLIMVLGLNKAVVFCHLLGIQDAINNKREKQDAIYQQQDRLIYDLGLSKATIIKTIKELEDLKLLHKIKGAEGNKTKYLIDKFNYNKLIDIINDLDIKNIKKNKHNASVLKKDVLNLYYEWCKNNTTSSDNFDTTNKDLIEKEYKNKTKSIRHFLSENAHQPITINYNENNIFKKSASYQFIPLLFKDEYTTDEIYETLNKTSNVYYDEIETLEYFLKSYYRYYGYPHKQLTAPKIREILQTIHNALNLSYIRDDKNVIKDIIDEYFNTPNKKDRDLTIHLFLSNKNGYYSWINQIAVRLTYASESDIY